MVPEKHLRQIPGRLEHERTNRLMVDRLVFTVRLAETRPEVVLKLGMRFASIVEEAQPSSDILPTKDLCERRGQPGNLK